MLAVQNTGLLLMTNLVRGLEDAIASSIIKSIHSISKEEGVQVEFEGTGD